MLEMNVGDEFLIHTFKAHLTVGILTQLKLTSTSDPLTHTESSEWLNHTAKKLVSSLLMPHKSMDAVYNLHSAFLLPTSCIFLL